MVGKIRKKRLKLRSCCDCDAEPPCFFVAHKAETDGYEYFIRCQECGSETNHYSSLFVARDAWNRRMVSGSRMR